MSLAACGGKDKKKSKTPDETGKVGKDGKVKNPEDIDPEGGLPGTGGDGKDGKTAGGGDGKDGGGGKDGDKPAPEIKPPGLDLTPAQKQTKLREHLGKGQRAVSGSSPDPNEGVKQAQLALAVDETNVDAMILLAHSNYLKKYYDQSEDILRKAARGKGKSRKEIHFLLGLVYDKTERPDDAMRSFMQSVTIDPNYKSGLMNLGVHYLRNRRYGDAVRTFEHLTRQLKVATPAAYTNLGSSYRGRSADATSDTTRRNQFLSAAESMYKRAISMDKNYANAYYNLGLLYLDADPFPASAGKDLDNLVRLKRAKTYFDEYRRLPAADTKRADEVAAVAQKLIAREQRIRKKAADREKKRKQREKDGDGGFE